jgi:CRISPR/Cas system-associated protein Cas10 (large subunit of type III CRISPR-Cas system)
MVPCSTDLVRPQSLLEKRFGKDGERISESVFQRRAYGKMNKQGFYEEETGISALANFVSDLGGLSDDKSQGNLHHKLAVLYLDGNGFGALQTACKTPEELKKFDTDIKGKRRDFLKALFEEKILKENGWKTGIGEIRLEILLWGGDEMILVVPAWKGWETLDFFYRKASEWHIGEKALHHAGGLVFCHHKANIHRITALAKELAELAKHDRSRSLFLSKALESFDHIGDKAESFFAKSARPVTGEVDYRPFVLDGLNMPEIAEKVATLKRNEFPRSKFYQYLKELHTGKQSEARETILTAVNESNAHETVEALTGLLNGEAMCWLHIAELWDYIPVERPVAVQGGGQ